MATIKRIRANGRNAQKSTGARSAEDRDTVRFNPLAPGLRAQSAVLPGESQAEFDEQLARLISAWMPQDEFEKWLVEQIAVLQWKLAVSTAARPASKVNPCPPWITPQPSGLTTGYR
jgi:hypothetical protein